MDSVAAQFRFWTTNVGALTDEDFVAAVPTDGEGASAKHILGDAYMRTYSSAFVDRHQPPVVRLLGHLYFNDIPLSKLQKSKLVKEVFGAGSAKELVRRENRGIYKQFLDDNKALLGDVYFEYFMECFNRAFDEYTRPAEPGKRRRPNWLAVGFNLAWKKSEAKGKSDLHERNADLTQSMHLLVVDYMTGVLKRSVERFACGQSQLLPKSVDRLLRLKGYVGGGPYVDDSRKVIAQRIPAIIEDIESWPRTNTRRDELPAAIASHIFVEATKLADAHIRRIIDDLGSPPFDRDATEVDAEIERLKQRRENLATYGAKPRGKGNKGIGPGGVKDVYEQNIDKFLNAHIAAETRPDLVAAEVIKIAPIICEAVALIESAEFGTAAFWKKLDALEKQTREYYGLDQANAYWRKNDARYPSIGQYTPIRKYCEQKLTARI